MTPRVFLIALVGALGAGVAWPAGAEELRMTASVWPPYVEQGRNNHGFAIALVTDALERGGYETRFSIAPWPSGLEATQAGDFDVFCNLWYTDERAETLAFSEPYIENHISFAKLSDNAFRYDDRADLDGLRIGIVDDYAYAEQAYDTTGILVTEAGSVRENIERLLAGDIDLVLADSRVALYEVNELSAAKNITVLRQEVTTRGLRIAVSKQHSEYREIISAFNDAIAAMKADGSYNTILANYRVSY